MLVLSHDGRRAYTANVGPGTVSVIDLETRKVLKVIPISANTQRISISPDDKSVFTADQTKPQMAVVDTATDTVAKWIPMEGIGYGSAPTPDGRWLLVALPDQNKVAVIDSRPCRLRAPCRRRISAGNYCAPRRQVRLRLLRTCQPGRRNRHDNVDSHPHHPHRQIDRRPGLGRTVMAQRADFYSQFRRASEERWQNISIQPQIWGYQIQPGTRWNSGLSEDDLARYEKEMDIRFPPELRAFFRGMNGTDKAALDTRGSQRRGTPFGASVLLLSKRYRADQTPHRFSVDRP